MPGLVGGAFEDSGLDAGVGDALFDVADEHVGHDLGAVQQPARALVVEAERNVVVGVQAGRHDDVQVGGRGDPGDARDVAAQPDHGEVDDGVHAPGLQFVEARNGVGHPLFLVAPGFGIVQRDFGGHDEHVLMHERDAEIVRYRWFRERYLVLTRH